MKTPPFVPAFKGQSMSDNKDNIEARKAFRTSDNKGPLTEYEKEQKALRMNLERLKAERLAREAAKLKGERQ
jgi:hypothetical protein